MTRALALVCCTACFLLSHTASAKPKVALTAIEGDASGDVRDAVAEALEGKELSLIGSREVNRAVDRLGDLADLTEKDFKKLAAELEADAIVIGKFDKVGTAKTLKFRLFIHKKMAKGFTVSFKSASSEKFRARLHDKIVDKIGAAPGGAEDDARPAKKPAGDDDDGLAARKDRKGKKPRGDVGADAAPTETDAEDARPAGKAKAAEAEGGGPDGDDEARPADGDEDTPRKARKKVAAADDGGEDDVEGGVVVVAEPRRAANRAAIRIDVGGSVLQRSFKFNSNIANNPKGATISPVPGARIEGEIYPFALSSSRGVLAGLGVGGEYDRTLGLNLAAKNTTTMTSFLVPVTQSHYSVGLRYRLAFGRTETSPTLTLGVGYGKRLFSTDLGKVNDPAVQADVRRDTPNTNYTVIDPGLAFRLPVTGWLALSLGGRGMIIPDAGSIQQTTSYGGARVFGVDSVAAIDLVLGRRFALRLSGEFVQIGFQFNGKGALSNGLDGDPNSKEVGGLADRSIGGSATFAVLY